MDIVWKDRLLWEKVTAAFPHYVLVPGPVCLTDPDVYFVEERAEFGAEFSVQVRLSC